LINIEPGINQSLIPEHHYPPIHNGLNSCNSGVRPESGIKETQEMLDFCGEHNIVCDVEIIDMQDINTAYERMLKSDVKYRFVIDTKSLERDN